MFLPTDNVFIISHYFHLRSRMECQKKLRVFKLLRISYVYTSYIFDLPWYITISDQPIVILEVVGRDEPCESPVWFK